MSTLAEQAELDRVRDQRRKAIETVENLRKQVASSEAQRTALGAANTTLAAQVAMLMAAKRALEDELTGTRSSALALPTATPRLRLPAFTFALGLSCGGGIAVLLHWWLAQ